MKSLFKSNPGFTLAELLIALAILGVIATFTIPKILSSSQNGQNTAIAKEAASMVSGAYSTYTLNNGAATGVTAGALTQYMNYVATDATAAAYTFGIACNTANVVCIKLHNGGVLQYSSNINFGATTGALPFSVDPDGAGAQTPITFWQYYNGRLSTGGQGAGTASGAPSSYVTTTDPSYLANWN